mgnify:CR=1 FL=1
MNELSLSGKNWRYKIFDSTYVEYLKENFFLDEITAKLLSIRNIKKDSIKSFLEPSIKNLVPNPNTLRDMEKTTLRLLKAINENQRHFGENYCQEGVEKIKAVTKPGIVWHFIGPVQSNKTNQISRYFNWVHTIDRIKIARRLDELRPEKMPPLNVCIQVNTSKETTKSGIRIDEIENWKIPPVKFK